ncbi:sugar phosphate isomerase/epimerase [Simiduia sp. 21SJ11W-1]|uniref:sugar phosphate isomerase/epimerase family protein n=1 Tax=Simiduia sp. 21SJ11W-1 TaxID=2909669 RepID=UPI00209D82B3|nr:TIM barrel protein [Simiduia sp. 21SJ11W-1]UTA48996.1 sugar phosphate isomerase/epimerase [Simiduia sp. 21SJ11W-1]
MNVQFFCPLWGLTDTPITDALAKIKSAGFVGVETAIPDARNSGEVVRHLVREFDLRLIAQAVMAPARTFEAYRKEYLEELTALVALRPALINCHTGRDFFSFEQNVQLLNEAQALADSSGVEIVHETHRGRFSFNPWEIHRYLEAVPGLKLNADFSHWCVVTESLMEDQQSLFEAVIPRCRHIHARVGYAQGPQVNDPRAPQWQAELDAHLHWWDSIIASQRDAGATQLTITPEFGPAPYMPTDVEKSRPLADQWELNQFIHQLLAERYAQ